MNSARSAALALVAFVLLLAVTLPTGCGDSPAGGGGTVDTTAPGIAAVTPVDMNHIQVTFSENVKEQTAEARDHYHIVERALVRAPTAAPGDSVPVSAAVLGADQKTVVLSTGSPMHGTGYDLTVRGVEDLAGNRMGGAVTGAFTGSNAADVTPPVLLARTPSPNATNVPVGQAVVLQFSESMDYSSVLAAFHWNSGGGAVVFEPRIEDGATFAFVPLVPLTPGTSYNVSLGAGARDWAGNGLATAAWSFQTTAQADHTPPTLVSSVPAAGATGVAAAGNLSMTFSEAVQPYLDEVLTTPDIGDGVLVWSSDGRTFTFDPYADLRPDTQYSVFVPPDAVRDVAGNGTVGPISIVFSTGSSLATGSFSGTVSGDPASGAASDPAGTIVVAGDATPFAEGNFGVAGSDVAASGGSYSVQMLPDGTYWPFGFKETNGDGRINPELGDAFGVYGVDFAAGTGEPDSLTITGGGMVAGTGFTLFDPVSLSGSVAYEGSRYPECCYQFFVGVFDTTGFDPGNPGASEPLHSTTGGVPNDPRWYINQFDQGIVPGTYYVGAYMDANFNSMLDAEDPVALYESGGLPVAVTLEHGDDRLGIAFHLQDPVPGAGTQLRMRWPAAKAAPDTPEQRLFRHLVSLSHRIPLPQRPAVAP